MGNTINSCGKGCGKGTDSSVNTPIENLGVSDRSKIRNFKNKCKMISSTKNMTSMNKIDVLHDALKDLNITQDTLDNFYILEHVLGSGKYGVVKKGYSIRNTDFKVAVKCIELEKLTGNYHSCISEVLTLRKVDHPNIVKIYEIFKDQEFLYIVMEYVDGKELFEFVVEHTKINETDSADITGQLLKTIKYLNLLNICHRDIKPENILINPKTLHVKVIDFGLSTYFSDFQQLVTKVGTPYYVSPEVLKGNYNKQCDMWSVGVITYILLTGCPPFQGENLAEVYNEILYEKLKLYRSDWEELSAHSLEFVKSMLKKNPDSRLTPDEGLKHPFVTQKSVKQMIKPSVLKKLAKANQNSYLKKEIFVILSTYIKNDVIEKWNKIFHSLDTDGTGKIKMSEVIKMLKDTKVSAKRIDIIEKMYENNEEATVSYTDFLSKVINVKREIKEEDVRKAFEQLDADKSGKIEVDDINSLLQRRGNEHLKAETLMSEVDGGKLLRVVSVDTENETDPEYNRDQIGYGTFKEFVLGGDDGVSEYSDISRRSSMIQDGDYGPVYDIKGSMAGHFESIMIPVDEQPGEEEKTD
jgi:calcium-dependent protein kinase